VEDPTRWRRILISVAAGGIAAHWCDISDVAELKRSNKDLEQFAYAAAHDMQEPLRSVTSFLELFQKKYGEQFDQTANQYVGYAFGGAVRMQQLIADLLAYSRVGLRSALLS